VSNANRINSAHNPRDHMTNYRRAHTPGATWFFTVTLAERHGNRLLVDHIDRLRQTVLDVKRRHPFRIDALVVLPDHLHCLWTLPPGETDYGTRWGLIKAGFSRGIAAGEALSASRSKRGERGLWQRRFWEHLIRDDADFARHADYIHWNPVKHGHVGRVADWPYSTFHAWVARGVYAADWGGGDDVELAAGE
jgi:REP-associated tyrosine transposase